MPSTSDPWYSHYVRVYARMIRDGHVFAHASYRDGEWRAILGYPGANVDGTEYDPELGAALARTLMGPVPSWCAFWPEDDVGVDVRPRALDWIGRHAGDVFWLPDCPIRRANEHGAIAPLFRALREEDVALVGPPHLRGLPDDVIGPHRFIEAHPSEAWRSAEALAAEVALLGRNTTVLFAAGMASNLVIARLCPHIDQGDGRQLLDVGSILDPYCGVFSRGYMRDPRWQAEIMPRNLA